MSKIQFTLFFQVVNEKDGKKATRICLLVNLVIVKIVLIVLEAYSCIAVFSGDAQGRDALKIFALCLMRITSTRFRSQFTKEFCASACSGC